MPLTLPTIPAPFDYFRVDIQNAAFVNALPGVNPTFLDIYGANVAGYDIFQGLRELQQIDVNLYNLHEFVAQQTADIASFTEFIANNLPSGGGVDLSLVEFNLQSILRDTSNIAQTLGGGAPLGFGDIVNALDNGLFDIANAIFQTGAKPIVDFSGVTLALTAGVEGTFGNAVDKDLRALDQTLRLLLQVIAQASGTGDPATQKIADNTRNFARTDAVSQLFSTILGGAPIMDFLNYLKNSDMADMAERARDALEAVARTIEDAEVRAEVIEATKDLGSPIGKNSLQAHLVDNVHWLMAGDHSVVTSLIKKLFGLVGEVAEAFEPALKAIFQPAFENMLKVVRDRVTASGEIGPTQGFQSAADWLSAAAAAGSHAHHLSHLLEMIPWTKFLGLNMLPAFLSDMAGFGQIAAGTWGKAIGEGVGRPAGYEINALMRSKLPEEGALQEAVQRRNLSTQDFATLLAFHGYSDQYIDLIMNNVWKNPTLREILLLVQDTPIDAQTVAFLLRDAGYDEKLIERILPALMRKRTINERSQLVVEVRNNLRDGFLGEQDARFYFDQVGMAPDEQELSLQTARLASRRAAIADNIATYRQLYGDGLLDDADFRLGLQSQGITEARIAVELSQVANKRFGQVADAEAAETKAEMRKQQGLLISTLREAFQHGQIDAVNFEQTLEHGGITRATASATVELERIKLEGRALTVRSAAAARAMQQEIRLREDTFVELFRKGLISNLQLQQFLLGLGLPGAVVTATVERETARALPTNADLAKLPAALKAKELFTLAKAKLQVQFAKAAIDANQYLTQLVALGVDADIARATVALEVARRGAEKQPPAPATKSTESLAALKKQVDDALEKFTQTDQTEAALEDVLSRLGILEEVVDALVALANEQAAALAAQETAVS